VQFLSATRLSQRLLSLLISTIFVVSLLSACGADPTSTPVPTTAVPTKAVTTVAATTAAAVTTVATTVAATTAAPTTVAPTKAATTAASTTAVATAATSIAPTRAVTTATIAGSANQPSGTVRVVAAPTAPPNVTPVKLPTSSAPRPAINALSKVDALLIDLIEVYSKKQGTEAEKLQAARDFALDSEVLFEDHDEVLMDIEATKADAKTIADKITAMGGIVDDTVEIQGNTSLIIAVPLKIFVTYANPTSKDNFLLDLAKMQGVKLINLPFNYDTQGLANLPNDVEALKVLAQTAKNEGVQIMGVDKWQAAGFKGKGVTIGILDSGYKFIDQLKGSYLPADFTVMDFAQKLFKEDSANTGVHGTAVSEIIYSLAPEAKLVATSVRGSNAEFSEAIDYLVSQKVDFISVSMGNNSVAEDGTTALSRKIEQVNKDTGIVFFFAAGNEGQEHYGGMFNPTSKGFHQFIPGVDRMGIGNPSDSPVRTNVIMRWDQWLNGDVNPNAADFDLVIEDEKGNVLATIDGDQRVRPPLETEGITLGPKALIYLKVKLKDGTPQPTQPVRLHIFTTGGINPQFITPVMSVGTNADSKGAVGVGAIDPPAGADIGGYSSQGPISDGRLKPEISAPGGVGSASYEADGKTKVFTGTSAATPQVSGLAAVLKGASPGLTSLQVVQVIFENAKAPTGVTVPNSVYGYGIANIGGLTPGPVQPKGNLPPLAAPNPNPAMPIQILLFYPTPVPANP